MGKIVNLSSMGGRLTLPGGGAYHASKYAVEALSDALRFEVWPFGIDVILIEPGLIKSAFGETAAAHIAVAPGDPYAGFNAAIATDTTRAYQKGLMARLGGSRTTSPASSRRPSPPSTHAPATRSRCRPGC